MLLFLFTNAKTVLQENNIFMQYIYIKNYTAANYRNWIINAVLVVDDEYEYAHHLTRKTIWLYLTSVFSPNKQCGIIS